MRKVVIAACVALAAGAAGTAWWWMAADAQQVTVDAIGDQVQTLARGKLPVFADTGDLQRLYAFAARNVDTLTWMPCTCGCGSLGHTSNRSCYVKNETEGRVTFTSHAAT